MSQTPDQGAQDAGVSPGSSPEPRDEWAPNPDDITDPLAEADAGTTAGGTTAGGTTAAGNTAAGTTAAGTAGAGTADPADDVDLPDPPVVEPTD